MRKVGQIDRRGFVARATEPFFLTRCVYAWDGFPGGGSSRFGRESNAASGVRGESIAIVQFSEALIATGSHLQLKDINDLQVQVLSVHLGFVKPDHVGSKAVRGQANSDELLEAFYSRGATCLLVVPVEGK